MNIKINTEDSSATKVSEDIPSCFHCLRYLHLQP